MGGDLARVLNGTLARLLAVLALGIFAGGGGSYLARGQLDVGAIPRSDAEIRSLAKEEVANEARVQDVKHKGLCEKLDAQKIATDQVAERVGEVEGAVRELEDAVGDVEETVVGVQDSVDDLRTVILQRLPAPRAPPPQ